MNVLECPQYLDREIEDLSRALELTRDLCQGTGNGSGDGYDSRDESFLLPSFSIRDPSPR